MTDVAMSGSHEIGARTNPSEGKTLLDPSASGPAHSLVRIAGGNRVVAVIVANVTSFVVLAIAIGAIGLLITHVLSHGTIGTWDHHVSRYLDVHRRRNWDRWSGDATNLADTFEVAGAAVAITIVLLIRKWGRHAFLLVAGLVIELSVFLTTNVIVKRPRPTVHHLGGTPSTYGFPSGHTAATVVVYGGLALIVMVATTRRTPRVAVWVLAVALTIIVGLSRVFRGEHYPTDVISGFLLGVGSLTAAVFIIRVACVNLSQDPDNKVPEVSSNAGRPWQVPS